MKLLHTSDWHLGRLFHGIRLTGDQKIILNQICEIAEAQQVDAVLIAGDIYDRPVPPAEAVELLNLTLECLVLKLNIPVILIAGNHDNPERIEYGRAILRGGGLHVRGMVNADIDPVILSSKGEKLIVYPVPYAEPSEIRTLYNEPGIVDHDKAMRAQMDKIREVHPEGAKSVIMAHGYVMGSSTSESERPLSIGGAEEIGIEAFEGFDYVALGHLHRPQKVKLNSIRYSGSPLAYSFSEASDKKSVTIITLEGASPEIEIIPLQPRFAVRQLEGELDELISKGKVDDSREDYVSAILTDKGALIQPFARLKEVYPHLIHMEQPRLQAMEGQFKPKEGMDYRKRKDLDLFQDFYSQIRGEEMSEDAVRELTAILENLRDEERRA
ncbi:exonuclease SbcCD subunit D [bacterium]|nr:exonuclease SbcCD subunit D [bacterium]